MTTFAVGPSPLQSAERLGELLGLNLYVKRDDLLPLSGGGGNKLRKAAHIMGAAERAGCDAVVTSGATQSNHARVIALVAAERGWACELVLHGDRAELENPTGNLLLSVLSGATITAVAPGDIGAAEEAAVERLTAAGHRPYLIPGGGHCLEGTLAFADAVDELREQCDAAPFLPEAIVLASGTGATQAGLIVGLARQVWDVRVIGISVARARERGAAVIAASCAEAAAHLELYGVPEVEFLDDWVGPGYGRAGADVRATIELAARTQGLVLDPTYTGKAFTGLADLARAGRLARGASVLFWHTGGLLNLMAAPEGMGARR